MRLSEEPSSSVTLDPLKLRGGQEYTIAEESSVDIGFGTSDQTTIVIPAGERISIGAVSGIGIAGGFSVTIMSNGIRLHLPLKAANQIAVKPQ